MMDKLMSETCWAHKKWNKIANDIKLVFYSSTITMMHGPINIQVIKWCMILHLDKHCAFFWSSTIRVNKKRNTILTIINFLWILVRFIGQMNCCILKSWRIYCSAEQASRALDISRTSRLYGVSWCSSTVFCTYALSIILTNNYSKQQIHIKRLKIVQKI